MNTRTRLLIMLPVLFGAGWLALFGDKTPGGSSAVVAAVVSDAAEHPAPGGSDVAPDNAAITGDVESAQIRRLRDRSNLVALEKAPQIDVFGGHGGEPDPGISPTAVPAATETPAQPFVMIGRMLDHDHWLAFLERAGRAYVVQARDVVEGFRIDAVTGQEIRLTQLADKSKFVIPIEGEKKEPAHD